MNRRAQTYTSDILIAVGIFLLTFIVFFYVLSDAEVGKQMALEEEAAIIPNRLIQGADGDPYGIIIDNQVVLNKLRLLSDKDYREMKDELGLTYDFCIIFEDKDGNIINLTSITGKASYGIGSSRMLVEGQPCGKS